MGILNEKEMNRRGKAIDAKFEKLPKGAGEKLNKAQVTGRKSATKKPAAKKKAATKKKC